MPLQTYGEYPWGCGGAVSACALKTGAKIVVKNNAPECVLMSPQKYQQIKENNVPEFTPPQPPEGLPPGCGDLKLVFESSKG